MLTAIVTTAAVALAGACDQDSVAGPRLVADVTARSAALEPVADTYIMEAQPNVTFGSDMLLRLMQLTPARHRALVRFDQAAIASAVGADSLGGATLELTISFTPINWGAGAGIGVHRLTQAWSESQATWNCAADAVGGNEQPDCSGTTDWVMGTPSSDPFVSTPTASRVILNGQTGVIQLDVTADVRAFLAGTANQGWLLKKLDETQEGRVEFAARESSSAPRLMLALVSGDTSRPAVPSGFIPPADSSKLVVGAGQDPSIYYRHLVEIRFGDSTSGGTIRAVLGRYQATIVGGRPSRQSYVVQVPDPVTLSAYDSLLNAIRREPGVFGVLRVIFRPSPRIIEPGGRYPSDGSQSLRDAWFTPTSATLPRIMVRAPMAWGCETGDYGQLARVGVIDLVVDSTHPDLASNLDAVHQPPAGDSMVPNQLFQADPLRQHHGTSVSGNLAAVGNNGKGVAGLLWKARIDFFALSRAGATPFDPFLAFEKQLDAAAAAGVRVLNVSLDLKITEPDDTSHIAFMALAVGRYLNSGGDRLLIVSTGNDSLDSSRTTWSRGIVGRASVLKAVIARMTPGSAERRRVILVAGTTASGGYAQFSNFIRGSTDIAAPAFNQLLLANRAMGAGDTVEYAGTSFAAPFVAGVAGLIWNMDPSLTAEDVRDYVLRGAQVPRPNQTSGVPAAPPAVSGAPETTYQLDAYGSLSLLSSERLGTPICGFPVEAELNADGSDARRLALRRPGSQVERFAVPGMTTDEWVGGLSIAQGGRTISVHVIDAGTLEFTRSILLDHHGTPMGTVPGRGRIFLERDTADAELRLVPFRGRRYIYYIRSADSTRAGTFDPVALIAGADADDCIGEGVVAPDGERVGLALSCPSGFGSYIVERNGNGIPLSPNGLPTAWAHDSRRVASSGGTDVDVYTASGVQVATKSLTRYALAHAFTSDGVLLDIREEEYDSVTETSTCHQVTRLVTTLNVVSDTLVPKDPALTYCPIPVRRMENIPIDRSARGRTSAFALFDALAAARGRAVPRRPGAPRASVN
jgi:subtilisin family serine protease